MPKALSQNKQAIQINQRELPVKKPLQVLLYLFAISFTLASYHP